MKYIVQFFRGENLYHWYECDLGLDIAKYHARFMYEAYGATSARVVDPRNRTVFECPEAPFDAESEA